MEIQKRNNDKEIFAPLKDKWLANKPEEEVRQKYICRLVDNYNYSLEQMAQGDGPDRHRGTVLLALVGVTGDMGCRDIALRKQARIHVRLVAPCVDDKRSKLGTGPQEGALVHDLAAGGVDEDGARLDLREEFVIGHRPCSLIQGDMERDDQRLGEEFVQRAEALGALFLSPGRVAAQDLEAQLPARALDLPADMPLPG